MCSCSTEVLSSLIFLTRSLEYCVEGGGVRDDIVQVKGATTVTTATWPPPVTTASNFFLSIAWIRKDYRDSLGERRGVFYLVSVVSPVCLSCWLARVESWVGGCATVCNTVVACQLGDWRVTDRVSDYTAIIALPAWIWHRGREDWDQHNISFLKTLIGILPPAKHSQNSPLRIVYIEKTLVLWLVICWVSFNINNTTQYTIYCMYNTL